MFQAMSIDQMPIEQITNLGINYTPMIVIRDNNGQNSSFEGKKAFEWLERIVKFREENMARIVEMNRKKILQANIQANAQTQNNILSFLPLETSGISDNFSYTAEHLQDVAQPKSFMPYGGDGDFKIATFKDDQGKMSTNELDDKLKQYTSKHSEQTSAIENIIESQMKNNLINKVTSQQ